VASLFVGHALTIHRLASAVVAFAGAALIAGVVTPIAGTSVALVTAAMAMSWMPSPSISVLDDRASLAFMAIVAIAIVLLGPGAYSIDARLFGRREIVFSTRD
jgi:uncharacterized membrane protein YphA (DoxX/SURF4 family)